MSISINRNRMHEMLAELGALVTTRPGPDATAPPSSWIAFRDRIVALPEVEAVSTVRRFRVEVAGQPTDIASMRWPRDRTGVFASRDSMTLRTDRGPRTLRIAGVYYDYSYDRDWVAMSRRTYGYSSIGVYARPGVGDARLRAAVEARLPESLGVGITQSRTIRAESMRLFDRTFAITRVLGLLAAVIAFAGVFSDS